MRAERAEARLSQRRTWRALFPAKTLRADGAGYTVPGVMDALPRRIPALFTWPIAGTCFPDSLSDRCAIGSPATLRHS